MPKVLYINSLSHSGSTLLDLALGCHPAMVGLGEVGKLISDYIHDPASQRERVCSCGETMTTCPFWSVVDEGLHQQVETSLENKYRLVYKTFDEIFGKDRILVDSSKYIPELETVYEHPDADVQALYLVRDVRGYTVSLLESKKRHKASNILTRRATYHFWHWWHSNRRLQQFLQRHGIPYKQVSYESLCLQPESTLREICAFLDLDFYPEMVTPSRSNSHILSGNRLRTSEETKKEITYDHRWFYKKHWIVPGLLAPHVLPYNARHVYQT